MHALKRPAARSNRAAISTSCSSVPVRGCLLRDLPPTTILPIAMSSSLKSSIGSSVGKLTCSAKPWRTVGVHGFGCWASVQLSLLSDSYSCSTSAELCNTVGRGKDKTSVVISQPDHFSQTPFNTIPRQTTINSITAPRQKHKLCRLLGKKGLEKIFASFSQRGQILLSPNLTLLMVANSSSTRCPSSFKSDEHLPRIALLFAECCRISCS